LDPLTRTWPASLRPPSMMILSIGVFGCLGFGIFW
jgi:hypothetical protein